MKILMLKHPSLKSVKRLETPPTQLYVSGVDISILTSKPCIAVVGTRKPTPYGQQVTEQLVAEFVRAGVVIISGLAFGIDILAHKTALREGGETIAVVPSDLHHIYPATHREVALKITEQGALVSEHTDNPTPQAHHFLERNRLIAALSDAVVVPEAAQRSGSLNTANHAARIRIPVFAAPGRLSDHMSAGTNHFIRTGRALAFEGTDDILATLNIASNSKNPEALTNPDEARVYEAIKAGIQDTTQLQIDLDIDTTQLQTILTSLEIDGHITQIPLGTWTPHL